MEIKLQHYSLALDCRSGRASSFRSINCDSCSPRVLWPTSRSWKILHIHHNKTALGHHRRNVHCHRSTGAPFAAGTKKSSDLVLYCVNIRVLCEYPGADNFENVCVGIIIFHSILQTLSIFIHGPVRGHPYRHPWSAEKYCHACHF